VTRPSEASVVPIRLTLDGRSGVTLWATPWIEDGEEWQAFLGTGERVLVFGQIPELADFLRSGVENDLSDHPSWSTLRTLPASQLQPEEGYDFDLDGAYDLALGDPDPFTVSTLSDLVDIVQRIAECCDDGTLLRVLEDSPEFSGLLTDEVTYSGPGGDERWTALAEALDRSWELVVGRLDGLLEWRNPVEVEAAEPVAEPAVATAAGGVDDLDGDDDDLDDLDVAAAPLTAADLDGDADDDEDDDDAGTAWDEAGIVPIALTVPTGTGYTLRTYVDSDARFLGADLTVDVFRSMDDLVTFIRAEDDHDLADLDTWPMVRDAEPGQLTVAPDEDETYDLTAPDEDAVELARDLADYCQLAGVEEALAGRPTDDSVPFDVWVAAVKEIGTCLRWHD